MVHTILFRVGFLTVRKAYRSGFLMLGVMLLTSCSKMVLRERTAESTPIWSQIGRGPQKNHFIASPMIPPFEQQWVIRASSAISNPLVSANGLVFYGTKDGKIEAVDIEKGKRIARLKIRGNIAATCLYYDRSLIVVRRIGQPTLERYDLLRGETIWRWRGKGTLGEPLLSHDFIYLTNPTGELTCLSLQDGKERWTKKFDRQLNSNPVAANGLVIVADDAGEVIALSGEDEAWRFQTKSSVRFTPAIAGTTVFVGSTDQSFYALNLADGKLLWTFPTGGKIYNGAAADGANVIFAATDSVVYCLDQATGALRWQFEMSAPPGTAPMIAGNFVYIGSMDKKLYALDLTNGQSVWSFEAKGRVRVTPIAVDNMLIFGSEDDRLYGLNCP